LYNHEVILIRRTRRLTAAACLIFAAACNGSSTAPAANAPFSQTDVRVGTGAAAASGNVIVVDYTGWLYDPTKADNKGLQFDTSVGGTPFEFTLGIGQVIAGWDQGLVGLRVGGLRRLVIPPSLAYGPARQTRIPANAGLVFDVELREIK
jgi:FKBP-type peptidyl-prolyl cis-trans isomerase FkpA